MDYAVGVNQATNNPYNSPGASSPTKDQPLTVEINECLSHSISLTERILKSLVDVGSRVYGGSPIALGGPQNEAQPQAPGFVGSYREGQRILTQNLINIETLALELASRT